MTRILTLAALGVLVGLSAPARLIADQPDDLQAPPIVLTIRPAAEPRPALKHRLLPAPSERQPGNAAPFYYRAILQLSGLPKDHWTQYEENFEAWHSFDPAVFPRADVAQWLPKGGWRDELQTAAYREFCEWDFRVQDLRGLQTLYFLLPEIQECRQLARLVKLQAHLEIMDGRPDEALRTLRQGYQLARDVAQPPLLVNALVGIAIAEMMNQELLALSEHSDINLYWAIASLPAPLVDMRPALLFEMNFPNQIFPFLQDAETAQRTPDEWRRLMVEFVQSAPLLDAGVAGSLPAGSWQGELAAAAIVVALYPPAKEALLASGLSRQHVEAMPAGQVVAIHTARSVDYAYHEVFKLAHLPYDEAMRRMPDVLARLEQQGYLRQGILSGKAGLPIAAILLPAVSSVMQAEVRASRNRAALQAIEALRMHAAATGSLPASLADVSIVPVPRNPATGEPFAYAFDPASGEATLEVPALPNLSSRHDAKRYVLRLHHRDAATPSD